MDRTLLGVGFDADWYLRAYPDVASAGLNPRRHFVRHGRAEGRDPGPWLASTWYLREHPEAAADHQSAFDHFARVGLAAGLPPHPDVAHHPLWRRVVEAEPAGRPAVFVEVLPVISRWLDDGDAPVGPLRAPLDGRRWERVLRSFSPATGAGA